MKDEDESNGSNGEQQQKKNLTWVLLAILVSIIAVLLIAFVGDDSDDAKSDFKPDENKPKAAKVTILHLNDHHSHLEEDSFDVEELAHLPAGSIGDAEEVEVFYGGFPRLVSLFKELQSEAETMGHDVIKLHAGDALVGTLWYTLFEGKADADLMNMICFDAFALGNHEFDHGDAKLANFITGLQSSTSCPDTPVLAANVVPGSDSPLVDSLLDYTIKTLDNGEQVGIIGIDIRNKTMVSSSPNEGTILLDEVKTATTQVKELEGMGVNKIVLLTHIGYENDLKWMTEIEGVDVVVGGDSHSLLGDKDNLDLIRMPQGKYPTTHAASDGRTVCVVQAWEYGHGVGKLDVMFDADGHVLSCVGQTVFPFDGVKFEPELDGDSASAMVSYLEDGFGGTFMAVDEDATTLATLKVYNDQIDAKYEKVIATVPETICYERIPGQGRSAICDVSESAVQGGGACQQVTKAFLSQTFEADFSIENSGGCRSDIEAGDFSYASAYKMLPFSNTLITLEMTGSEIVQVLEEALDNAFGDVTSDEYPYGGSTGAYPYCSGIRYTVDSNQGFGDRLVNVEVNPRLEGSWVGIDVDATYTVVANSYIAGGRDGYSTFGEIDESLVTDTYSEYAQTFIDYVADVGTLEDIPAEEYSTQVFFPVELGPLN